MSSQHKRPQSVLVLVCTQSGDVLLMKRVRPRGFWQSVTGALRWGETRRMAAQRELWEETGIQSGKQLYDCHLHERFRIMPSWSKRYAPNTRFNTEHWFIMRLPKRRLIHLNSLEHQDYRWLPAEQAMKKTTSWTNRKAIHRLIISHATG